MSSKMNNFIEYLNYIGYSDHIKMVGECFVLDNGKMIILGSETGMKVCNYKNNLIYGGYAEMRYPNSEYELEHYKNELDYIQSDECHKDYVAMENGEEYTGSHTTNPINFYKSLEELEDIDNF